MNPRHHNDPQNDFARRPDDYGQPRATGAHDEARSWREDSGGTYGQGGGYGRNEGYSQHESRRGGGQHHASLTQGGYRGGDWSQGGGYGQTATGGQLYGGYDRHGAGQTYGQSGYGAQAGGGYDQRSAAPPYGGYAGGDATGRQGHRMGQGGMMNEGRYAERQEYYGLQGDRGQFSGDPYAQSSAGYGQAFRTGGEYGPEPSRGYAPGSQIWESQSYAGRQQDPEFEPDYLHWRESQMRNLDRDYQSWRDERRQKFSQDFDEWRNRRATQASAEQQPPADNPAVGDVSDGGTGRDDRKKN